MRRRFAEDSPEEQFRRLDHTHRGARDALLTRFGLTNMGQPMLLVLLSQSPGGMIESQKELAERMHVSPATITVSLRSMEKAGYITKLSDENDMRRKPIAITEKGMDAVDRIDQAFDLLDRGMYQGFSPAERTQISELFSRMIDNLNTLCEGDDPES